jgi:hypothetical protein
VNGAANTAPTPAHASAAAAEAVPPVALSADSDLWEQAQAAEKPGAGFDIQKAIKLYGRIVDDFPQSAHYEAARSRLAYLQRNYIELR